MSKNFPSLPSTGAALTILGIPCDLTTAQAQKAVRHVLTRIQNRQPKDFARLQTLVRGFWPVSPDDAAKGVNGEWQRDYLYPDPEDLGFTVTGTVFLEETGTFDHLVGVVAHELGHACTRESDLERRGAVPTDDWASELAADWYAYRWGFGRHIAADRRDRKLAHHGPPPGYRFEIDMDGVVVEYRVTRNFRVHALKTSPTQ